MTERVWLVVGDRFWQFAVDRNAITVSYLRGLLNSVRGDDIPDGLMIMVLGQGVSDEDVAELLAMAQHSPHSHRFDFSRWADRAKRAPGQITHKLRVENILLSEARKNPDGSYSMDMMLDDHCELMMDHQTGRHLAGVVLIEAVRQSLLVVTEGHYFQRDGKKHEFTFHNLSVNFHRYCFPFLATLQYVIRNCAVRGNRHRFEVDVTITQCGEIVMTAVANMTAHSSPLISKVESEQATRSLNWYLESIAQSTSAPVEDQARSESNSHPEVEALEG